MIVTLGLILLYCLCGLAVADDVVRSTRDATDEVSFIVFMYAMVMLFWPWIWMAKGFKRWKAMRVYAERTRGRMAQPKSKRSDQG